MEDIRCACFFEWVRDPELDGDHGSAEDYGTGLGTL